MEGSGYVRVVRYRHQRLRSRCARFDAGVQSRSMVEQQKMAIFTEVSLILAAVFWGLNYATTKYAAEFLPPLLIVALRFTTGGILMYCLLRIVEPDDRL